ncbi:MAG: serine/threonine protein kinase, partial [Alphaproteobacteria bacterium]|nr:serine/threonine protein kinase [Alphaproteobacteria bacterium]
MTEPTGAEEASTRRQVLAVRCAGCGGAFWLDADDTADVPRRCVGCRLLVRRGSRDDERWVYPLPDASRLDLEGSQDATGATVSLDDLADVPAPAPRTIDRYVLHGELGRGGVGVVYDAYDPDLGRHVALKVLAGGAFASPAAVRRFQAEARAAAALEHPGIVGVLDVGTVDGVPYFTMRRVVGPSLEQVLRAHGPLPIREAARITLEVCRAVQRAHLGGVAHRDLKPGNVLLTCDGVPLVTDFGLAKVVHADQGLTATEAVLGTPAYMAPEVAAAARDIDWFGVDVYGLGALLHGALTGKGPSAGATRSGSMARARSGHRPAVRSLRADLPWELEGILDVALCPEPSGRYASAGALGDDLQRFLDGRVPVARPDGALGRLRRHVRRHRALLLAFTAATLTTTASLVWPEVRAARVERARQEAAEVAWAATSRRLAAEPDADRAAQLFAA